MRWLSVDQKPSWWNNAGLTGTFAKKCGSQPSVNENFAHPKLKRYKKDDGTLCAIDLWKAAEDNIMKSERFHDLRILETQEESFSNTAFGPATLRWHLRATMICWTISIPSMTMDTALAR